MGERLLCKQEVIVSIPFTSTRRVSCEKRHGTTGTAPRRRSFFDMVKRECVAEWIKPFGSVSVFTREMRQVRVGGVFPCSRRVLLETGEAIRPSKSE